MPNGTVSLTSTKTPSRASTPADPVPPERDPSCVRRPRAVTTKTACSLPGSPREDDRVAGEYVAFRRSRKGTCAAAEPVSPDGDTSYSRRMRCAADGGGWTAQRGGGASRAGVGSGRGTCGGGGRRDPSRGTAIHGVVDVRAVRTGGESKCGRGVQVRMRRMRMFATTMGGTALVGHQVGGDNVNMQRHLPDVRMCVAGTRYVV